MMRIRDDASVSGRYTVGAKNFSPLHGTSKTVGSVVRGFKIGVTTWMRANTDIHVVWQRNYWEHIVRDEAELNRIREYIATNPVRWEMDRLHPEQGLRETSATYGADDPVDDGDWMI